ncbi:hypothetical protein Rhow_008426 [Rhodococcus wratislaviensis]|uniref:Uncharacterized protein n=1 Tax=Rhodococcus wratislaviensis TaxID=44752 RepID=A0A402CKR2_RHOWR|nr:hypothetical protein Rhow_008426 [Rhodococcus wratislaviensis]
MPVTSRRIQIESERPSRLRDDVHSLLQYVGTPALNIGTLKTSAAAKTAEHRPSGIPRRDVFI